jgi:hypothetical protein
MDGTFASIPDIAAWRLFIRAKTVKGAENFAHSQALKAALAAAATLAEVDAIYWGMSTT